MENEHLTDEILRLQGDVLKLSEESVKMNDDLDMKSREITRLHTVCQKKDLETIELMRHFMYFTANFPLNFIEECWQNSPQWLRDHLKGKLESKADQENCITMGAFVKFFFDLDGENQRKLILYVIENYHKSKK